MQIQSFIHTQIKTDLDPSIAFTRQKSSNIKAIIDKVNIPGAAQTRISQYYPLLRLRKNLQYCHVLTKAGLSKISLDLGLSTPSLKPRKTQ